MNFCKIERLKKKKDKFFGKNANVCAWITRMRKLGKILFVIVQDGSDSMQIMVKDNQLLENIKGMRRGDLLEFRGKLKKKFGSEEIEMELSSFKIINKTLEELPFDTEEQRITEETRYKYRYLDLRRTESKRKLFIKSEFIFQIRKFLNDKGFWDIETPILSQKSPEGSKCFLVQSPIDGKYYTLAQSPQIFKQTLMIGGICKYYQIAKSFRNEDSRSNRQIEFSQLDIEMSFSSSKEIKKLIEKLIKKSLKCVFGISLDLPFETISYDDAIKKYKSEKPDTRSSAEINQGKIKFLWIDRWPLFEKDEYKEKYKSFRHPFTTMIKSQVNGFAKGKISPDLLISDSFDLICNGEEILSGGMRINNRFIQERVFELLGYNEESRDENFGYFLKALGFAAPPHGGFGLGIDRLLSVLLGSSNLKELIAFPKNIDGTCSLTDAPNLM